jgi:hypothetical protein
MLNYINFDEPTPDQQASLGTNPKLQQKRLLAQLLLQQGMQQESTGGHWSRALPRATNQILGVLLGRQANEELKAQQDQDQADMTRMLAGGKPGSWTNPDTGEAKSYGGGIQGVIDAGLATNNPRLLPQVQALQFEKYKTDADLAQKMRLADYEQQLKANQKVKLGPGDVYYDPAIKQAEYTAPNKSNLLTPEEAQQKIHIGTEIAKARRPPVAQYEPVLDAAGQPVAQRNTVTGQVEADPRYKPLSPATLTNIKGKLVTIDLIKGQLEKVKVAWEKAKKGLTGPLGQYVPSRAGEAFDAAIAALQPTLRQISRTPGEGSMSDYESKLANAQLPARGKWFKSTTQAQIDQLDDLIASIESGYRGMLGNTGVPTPDGARGQGNPGTSAPASADDLNPMIPKVGKGLYLGEKDGLKFYSDVKGNQYILTPEGDWHKVKPGQQIEF